MLLMLDWDGTLLDSSGKIIRCMQKAAEELALPALSDLDVKQIIGLGLPEAIATLFPDIEEVKQHRFKDCYAGHFVEADQTPCEFFPGVLETLSALKEAGHFLAVATGKSRRGLDRVLSNLDMQHFFHASRCADETRSKPHPLMLQELLQEFSLPTEEALMVGDTTYDLEMALQANVASVGVTYGVHEKEHLQEFKPIAMINQFDDLPEILERWQAG